MCRGKSSRHGCIERSSKASMETNPHQKGFGLICANHTNVRHCKNLFSWNTTLPLLLRGKRSAYGALSLSLFDIFYLYYPKNQNPNFFCPFCHSFNPYLPTCPCKMTSISPFMFYFRPINLKKLKLALLGHLPWRFHKSIFFILCGRF